MRAGKGGMALSTVLQNYLAKFLLGEHKTTASGCWPTLAKFMTRLYAEMEKRMEVSPFT